ncbi:hypothetical protein ACOXXX_16785 [Thalassococcus sp. BH17M4-6]|uniref:hypothetical protein n=1 Tax=Thalassococcus sp. BH17M4-6 TaxID=3413148 RepID=UPI003BBC37DD
MRYEYKVVPAPAKGEKAKGVKAPEGRFAFALEHLLNDFGQDGWEFQRAETLPSDERQGLTGSVTVWRNVLVFRRPIGEVAQETPRMLESPERISPVAGLGAAGMALGADDAPAPPPAAPSEPADDAPETDPDWQRPVPTEVEEVDNGVEETRDLDKPVGFLHDRAARMKTDPG